MDIYLEQVLEDVRVVDSRRDYWFLRTYSGQLYDYFKENNHVGLGLNHVPYQYIKEGSKSDRPAFERLQKYIESNTNLAKGEVTKWSNQLLTFEHNIAIGDIVIIPSKNSELYSFGIIESETYVSSNPGTFQYGEKYEPYPEKRKKVKWLKEIAKEDLQGDLRALSSTQQALTSAYKFSETIEGHLSTLYIKEGKIFLTIKIDQDEDINAFELNRFLESLTYFYKEFSKEYGIEDNEDLYIKIKLQSPGKIALKAVKNAAIIGIVGVMLLSNSNKTEIGFLGAELKNESDGFLASISDFLDRNQQREIEYIKFQDSIERLKVKPVQDSISAEADSIASKE